MILGPATAAVVLAGAVRLIARSLRGLLGDAFRLLRAVGAFLWTTIAFVLLVSATLLRHTARLTIGTAIAGIGAIVRGGAIDIETRATIAHLPPAAAAFAPGGRLHRPTSGAFTAFVSARPAIAASIAGGIASVAVAGVIGLAIVTTSTPTLARTVIPVSLADIAADEYEERDPAFVAPTPTPTPEPTPKPRVVPSSTGTYGTGAKFRPANGQQAIFWPVPNYDRVSQRFHAGHKAWDISASTGEDIVAAVGGTVRVAELRRGSAANAGKTVWIEGDDGLWITYNHMSKIIVTVGQRVEAGERIGLIGTTGKTTGPHVHFDIHVGRPYRSQVINPAYYLTIP